MQCRCCAKEDQPGNGLKRFLNWSKKFWESLTAEEQNQPAEDDSSQPSGRLRDSTPAQPLNASESQANGLAGAEEIGFPDAMETVELADDARPIRQGKPGSAHPQVQLSTIRKYDPEESEGDEARTRSSVGKESVRIEAEKGAFARIGNTNAQKSYFDKIIKAASKREHEERELKQQQKDFYHLSRRMKITRTEPDRSNNLTGEEWDEVILSILQ